MWFLYVTLPFGIVFAAAESGSVLARGGSGLRQLGVGAGVGAGIAMALGLVRWPTIEWALARHWETAPVASRPALAAIFDASNLYLGNVISEFVGEMATALWFAALGIAFRRDGGRVLGSFGLAAALLVAVAALRNITGAVRLVSEVNNFTLPLWLVALGVVFVRDSRASS